MKHLAIFKEDGAEKILSGKKSIESRFSKSKIAPFGVVSKGDLVYIKVAGGEIIGQFRVKKVIYFDNPMSSDILDIKKRFENELGVDEIYWLNKLDTKYVTLVFIGDCTRFITSPIKIPKKDQRSWVVLG